MAEEINEGFLNESLKESREDFLIEFPKKSFREIQEKFLKKYLHKCRTHVTPKT